MNLRARPTDWKDLRLLFNWANDPETRKNSFCSEPITLGEHQKWLTNLLNDSRCLALIIEGNDDGEWLPIAFFRVDADAEVGFVLAPEYRGRHLATPAYKLGISIAETRYSVIVGHMKPNKNASK